MANQKCKIHIFGAEPLINSADIPHQAMNLTVDHAQKMSNKYNTIQNIAAFSTSIKAMRSNSELMDDVTAIEQAYREAEAGGTNNSSIRQTQKAVFEHANDRGLNSKPSSPPPIFLATNKSKNTLN